MAMGSKYAAAEVVDASQKKKMRINQMGGEVLDLVLSSTDSILHVKDQIYLASQIPQERQKLICGHVVMEDRAVVKDYCKDNEGLLDVSMVVINPLWEVYTALMDHGLTKPAPISVSEVQRKLAILERSTGGVALPACVTEWFTLLAENGSASSFFDLNGAASKFFDIHDLVENSRFNSHSLLCFHFEEWGCPEGVLQRSVGLMDLSTDNGALSYYCMVEDDEGWDGPASKWQKHARPGTPCLMNVKKERYSSFAELLLEKVDEVKAQKEKERKHMDFTENNTRLVIAIWKKSTKTHVLTPKYVDCTIGEFKQYVSESTGIQRDALTVKRRHMFGRFIVYGEDHRLLSDCGYSGGSHISVYAD